QLRKAGTAGKVWIIVELGPMQPGPIFDDVKSARPQERKQGLKGSLSGAIEMGGIIQHKIKRAVELALHNIEESRTISLIRFPTGFYSMPEVPRTHIVLEIVAIVSVFCIYSYNFCGVENFIPNDQTSAIPHADFKDILRLKPFFLLEKFLVLIEKR